MSFWRKALTSVNATILSSKQSLGLQLKLQPEKDIFLFNAKEAVANWTASSDRSIGGLSECKWGFYTGKEKEEAEKSEQEVATEKHNQRIIETVNQKDDVPSAVFAGKLSMDCQPTEVGVVRSGYCAVRASVPGHLLLHGYEGLSMRVMTDGREYRVNVQMESWNPFNLYMLPFRHFMLTAKGFVKLDDETELDPAKLKSIGFAIADQKEGDFELRIQWIKAVAQLEDSDKNDYDDDDDDRFDSSNNKKDYFRKPADLII